MEQIPKQPKEQWRSLSDSIASAMDDLALSISAKYPQLRYTIGSESFADAHSAP